MLLIMDPTNLTIYGVSKYPFNIIYGQYEYMDYFFPEMDRNMGYK